MTTKYEITALMEQDSDGNWNETESQFLCGIHVVDGIDVDTREMGDGSVAAIYTIETDTPAHLVEQVLDFAADVISYKEVA